MIRKTTGFTLIEVIVSIFIIGIVAGAGALSLSNIIEGYAMAGEAAEITQKAQIALTRIAVEMEHVNATDEGVHNFSANSFWYSGVFGNNTVESHTISFDAANNEVLLDNFVVTDKVSALSFQYLAADMVSNVADAEDIRVIQIDLTMDGNMVHGRTFTTRVAPMPMQQ